MQTAVVTLTIGQEYEAIAKLTHPKLKQYAQRIGADFHVINGRQYPSAPVCYEKLQLTYLLGSSYQRIIYLDTDILVKPECPNLFEIVPLGWFGAFSEGRWVDRSDAFRKAHLQFGPLLTPWDWLKSYFNAGVMVFDRSHYEVFMAPYIFFNNFQDQTWMNIQVYRHCRDKFIDLGPHFNRMPFLRWEERSESHIIHYAGNPDHKTQIAQDLGEFF